MKMRDKYSEPVNFNKLMNQWKFKIAYDQVEIKTMWSIKCGVFQ